MRKSQKIVWLQWVERITPRLAPETQYCRPDSRFAMVMRLARMGASNKMFMRHIPGIDPATIRVARKLAAKQGAGETAEDEQTGVVRTWQRDGLWVCTGGPAAGMTKCWDS